MGGELFCPCVRPKAAIGCQQVGGTRERMRLTARRFGAVRTGLRRKREEKAINDARGGCCAVCGLFLVRPRGSPTGCPAVIGSAGSLHVKSPTVATSAHLGLFLLLEALPVLLRCVHVCLIMQRHFHGGVRAVHAAVARTRLPSGQLAYQLPLPPRIRKRALRLAKPWGSWNLRNCGIWAPPSHSDVASTPALCCSQTLGRLVVAEPQLPRDAAQYAAANAECSSSSGSPQMARCRLLTCSVLCRSRWTDGVGDFDWTRGIKRGEESISTLS